MLLRNTIYNLIGLGAPLLVAVVSIPALISALGTDRFGLLTLIWAVVSYFGVFDFGLGRALTQQLAIILAGDEHERICPLVATATLLMSTLGLGAGALMYAMAPSAIGLIKSVPDKQEAIQSLYAMACAMPAIILTSGFRGVLEARQAFGVINLIRLPMGLFTFLGPLAVVTYGSSQLDSIAWVLTAGRLLACAIHAWYAWKVLPPRAGTLTVQPNLLKSLLISGGWLTVSNVVSPLMGYVDRFVIGSLVSASAVAFYATPNELVTKLWIVPGALTAVLFPTFAAQMAGGHDNAMRTLKQAVLWVFITLLPITVGLALFAHEILSLWIGSTFADHSALLLQIFSIGILANCTATIPFTLLQSAGRSKITALIHCLELPFFLVTLWFFTSRYGVTGAAFAWLLRIAFDTFSMFFFSNRILGHRWQDIASSHVLGALAAACVGFLGSLLPRFEMRVIWLAILIVLLLFFSRTQIQQVAARMKMKRRAS
jgi:O-antigen/teichoic acid export membrane protein